MAGLSQELVTRCREILSRCDEFESHEKLRAVFVTNELYPFRDQVPAATTKKERVDRCLSFLLDRQIKGNRPVLPLFLIALHNKYNEGDALHDELSELAETVQSFFGSKQLKQSYPGISLLPQPYFAHPYALQRNFTGRTAERQMLTKWLTSDKRPILALVAIGGMGKSSLSWYWIQNDVDKTILDGVFWWSFYEREASFSRFLDEAIIYISGKTIDPTDYPSNYDKSRTLIKLLGQRHILLVLDGFERQLRAYGSLSAVYQRDKIIDDMTNDIVDARSCIDPNAARLLRDLSAGTTQAKVILTTRLMVRDLEDRVGDPLAGVCKEDLKSLHPDDAVIFMHAQGVTRGTHAEIIAVCESYGYRPLSLRLLSGLIARDKRNPGDIATASRHDIHTDLVARQHHVLETAYNFTSQRFADSIVSNGRIP